MQTFWRRPLVKSIIAARPYQEDWERKLAKYGLSWAWLQQQDVQNINVREPVPTMQTYQFDPELAKSWKTQAQKHSPVDRSELSDMSRVPVRYAGRYPADWAFNDEKVRTVLLAMYPRLFTTEAERRSHGGGMRRAKRTSAGVRNRCARTALMIYLAFRLGLTGNEIAEEMGVSRGAVAFRLMICRRFAKKLFPKDS
jgi:hypothetical protein